MLPRPARYVPHIYTGQELAAIFAQSDRCRYSPEAPSRHLVMPVLFRTIYACGLRASEARLLRPGDVEVSAGVLQIRNAKGVFPPDELWNTATEHYFEAIYASGVKMIVSNKERMGAPLMAHPIKVEALEVADDRLKGSVKRQRSACRWRHQLIRRQPGVGSRAGHADYAASLAFRWGRRLSTAECCRTVRSPR